MGAPSLELVGCEASPDSKPEPKIWIPFIIGAGNEVRTRDLDLGKVALYQLSYTRIVVSRIVSSVLSIT